MKILIGADEKPLGTASVTDGGELTYTGDAVVLKHLLALYAHQSSGEGILQLALARLHGRTWAKEIDDDDDPFVAGFVGFDDTTLARGRILSVRDRARMSRLSPADFRRATRLRRLLNRADRAVNPHDIPKDKNARAERLIDLAARYIAAESARETPADYDTVADWVTSQFDRLKTGHVLAAMTGGQGHRFAREPAWRQAVEQRLTRQLQYLENYAGQLADGKPLSAHRARISLYARALRGTYAMVRAHRASDDGAGEERRVLNPDAEHCDGCLNEASLGWQPIGSLTPIGECDCLSNCECRMSYRHAKIAI